MVWALGGQRPHKNVVKTPATTNWVQPERQDLFQILSAEVIEKCDANVAVDSQAGDAFDPNGPTRSALLLAQMVRKVRAAIRNAGHTPLSVTADCIPPESFDHVLAMAAWRLVQSQPSVQMVVITERGAYSPLGDLNRVAEEWVEGKVGAGGVRQGGIATHAITPPTDPTGRDWTTAIAYMTDVDDYTDAELASLTWSWKEMEALGYTLEEWQAMNPPIKGQVREGSLELPQDLRTAGVLSWPADVRATLGTP